MIALFVIIALAVLAMGILLGMVWWENRSFRKWAKDCVDRNVR